MPTDIIHFGSKEHKANIKASLVDNILKAGGLKKALEPNDKKVDEAISVFEDGLVKDDSLHYKKTISYEVWEDDTKFISYSGLYALGSWHEIDGTVFKVVDIQKNITTQNYEVLFVEAVPKPPLPTITTTSGDPVIMSGDPPLKIEPITDWEKDILEEPGHFNDIGVWVKDPALSQLTEREKLFKELTNGVTS